MKLRIYRFLFAALTLSIATRAGAALTITDAILYASDGIGNGADIVVEHGR